MIINSYGKYLKNRFGERVRKIPISLSGFTCPNIDGKVAKGGCTYCDNTSFSPNLTNHEEKFFLSDTTENNILLNTQIEELNSQYKKTKEIFRKKYGVKKYIIYFQSFTNTYGPMETLKKLYEIAIRKKDVVGLSIGTRADCVNDEILDYLQDLNKEKEITVEYGVQSVYDSTLKKINRGENYKDIARVIDETTKRDLKVCAHIIFGLPDETEEMMLESVKKVCSLGIDSIKIHPLYVVKNTLLEKSLIKKSFKTISEEEYLVTLSKAIQLIPSNIFVQRVTAGIDNGSLLEPKWCRNKNELINKIKKF